MRILKSALKIAQRSKILLFGLLLMLQVALAPSNRAYAGATLSLSPSGGNYSSQFQVNVNVAITGSSIYAFDLNINYTGPVDFVSGSAGNAGCSPVIQESATGTVSIVCLALQPLTSGTLASLYFTPTGSGASQMTIEVVDSDGTIDGTSGANFTVQQGGSALPTTSIQSHHLALIGASLLLSGGFLYMTAVDPTRIAAYFYKDEDPTLKEKIKP